MHVSRSTRSREETRGRAKPHIHMYVWLWGRVIGKWGVTCVMFVWKKGVGVGYPSGLIEKGVVRCETGSAQLLMQLALQPNFIFLYYYPLMFRLLLLINVNFSMGWGL